MKALSLWQPWCSLIAFGEKKVETRCWTTKHRGSIAIASTMNGPQIGLGMSRESELFHKFLIRAGEKHGWDHWYWPAFARYGQDKNTPPEEFAAARGKGAVLCIADLVAVASTDLVRDDLDEKELVFGNYEEGRYAWFFENVRRLERPLAVKGNRMLWNWNPPERKIQLADGSTFTVPES